MCESSAPKLMDSKLYIELQQFYRFDSHPEYFAGGHEWSDGSIYQYLHQGKEHLIKLMPMLNPEAKAAVLERQEWMEYLNLNGVGTVLPLHSAKDRLVESTADGKTMVYAWQKVMANHVPGRDLETRKQFYPRWGAMIGKIHHLSKKYPQWPYSKATDQDGVPLLSRQHEYSHFYNWIRDDEVRQAWKELGDHLKQLPINRDNYGFVHNDAHPGNILIEDGKLILIDFDVANYLWFILDLAICIFSEFAFIEHHSDNKALLPYMDEFFIKPFMQGYESENILDDEEYRRIEVFLRYRRFIMFAAFYDQIKDNAPAYLEKMKRELIEGCKFFKDDKDFTERWRD